MPPPPSSNIVAYWKMEEATGANRADATGNGHTAVPTGAPSSVTQVGGIIGNGAQFPIAIPTPTWLEVADSTDFHFGDADQTYWGWFKANDFLAGGTLQTKVGQYIFQAFRSSGHDWIEQYDMYYGGVGAFTRVGYSWTWATPTWEFWMIEYIAATNRLNLYRNDVTTPVDTAIMPFVPISTTGVIEIGESVSATAGHTWVMDEVGIANVVFTQEEKDCIFNGGVGGTYPSFCQGNIGWKFYMMKVNSGDVMSGQAYSTPTNIIFNGPTTGNKYYSAANVADTDGAGPDEEVEISLVRDGGASTNTDTRAQTAILLNVAIPTKDAQ